jgi:hypothetical protein
MPMKGTSAADNRNRVERMSDGSLAGVGKISDKARKDDHSDTSSDGTQPRKLIPWIRGSTDPTAATFAIVVKRAYGRPDGCRTRPEFHCVKFRRIGRGE